MNPEEAAALLVSRLRARPWGLAVVAIMGAEVSVRLDPGEDPLDESSSFQWGSITKTVTGVLLGCGIEAGELEEESTLEEVLGVSGPAGAISVLALATQRSGLPRLPPNLDAHAVVASDPYADYTESDLLAGLEQVEPGTPECAYSNFGYMALGLVLATVAGEPFPSLVQKRVAGPLGMSATGCPPADTGRLPGYTGAERTPWWATQVPGAGGVGGSIGDLAQYLQAHIDPPRGMLGAAVERATTIHAGPPDAVGYGWWNQGGGWWHNGGTGGFRSFAAFHRPTRTGVGLLANSGQAEVIDDVGFATLTEMVKESGSA